MKTYIEAIEDTEKEDKEFIQEEITGTQLSAQSKINTKLDSKKTYKLRKHFCYHDEETNKPCTVEDI